MNRAQRAVKLALWIEAQQLVSILDRAQIATLDREIEEAMSQIDETYNNIIKEAQPIIEEVESLLKKFGWSVFGLEVGQTEFSDDSISIDLPEWINLSEVDTSKYKITITGLASKTGSDSVNRRIAQQRAENAKKILLEKYWIKDEWQITIKIDLQSGHPDRLEEDVSKWQWVKVTIKPTTSQGEDPDGYVDNALADI